MKKLKLPAILPLPDLFALAGARAFAPEVNVVIHGTDGNETLTGTSEADSIFGLGGQDILAGEGGSDQLDGGDGDDVLDGGLGNDTMTGGNGNDTFFVDSFFDQVHENAGEGDFDFVLTEVDFDLNNTPAVELLAVKDASSLTPLSLVGNSLNNFLTGNAGHNHLDGGDGNDVLNGGAGDDFLIGGTGADQLTGNAGADIMDGGAGSDTYSVNDPNDIVIDLSPDSADRDETRIEAPMSFFTVEGQNIETITVAPSLTMDIELRGSDISQSFFSGGGNDLVSGFGGNDLLTGDGNPLQAGNDTLLGGDGADIIFGSGGNDVIMGGQGNDLQLEGDLGSDTIDGGDGRDFILIGFSEAGSEPETDVVTGGSGQDTFHLFANFGAPQITDFSHVDDKIEIFRASAPGVKLGILNPKAFVIDSRAHDSEDRIIYNKATGNVFFDQDGVGGAEQVLLVTLRNKPADLSAADFFIV